MPNHELIGAAKAGVEGLVRSAAATYASRSIRMNGVAPGLVDTALSASIVQNPTSLKVSESLHPLGKIGSPEDVASAICWLLDPEQQWVTGQIIGVDGGLSRVQPRPKLGPAKS
jgi:NAD(P)-dependent dehydrogenase (short-subunit alcohol dehydrogenase family)